jgi:hypothetical protein
MIPNAPSRDSSAALAWQGWRLDLPARWNPVKIEGDHNAGHVLLADLHGPRLGVRWKKAGGRQFDAATWARRALVDEVGQLAADEARPLAVRDGLQSSLLYIDPEPPGRDVWVAHSAVSRRVIQLVYRSRRHEHLLASLVLPTLADTPTDDPQPWSVFGLSCVTSPGMRLAKHQLNAGDLSLAFGGEKRELVVRQVAMARTALSRMPMEKWLNQQEWARRRHFRREGEPRAADVEAPGRTLKGLFSSMRRKRRFCLAWQIPRRLCTYVMQDEPRDRLVFVQSNEEALALETLRSVGWASGGG